MQVKLWEVVGKDTFMTNNENLQCIVVCYSKFPVMKNVKSMSAEDLIWTTKAVLTEGLPKKLQKFCFKAI